MKRHTHFLWRHYVPCFNWQLKWTRTGFCFCLHNPWHIKSEGCTIKKKKGYKNSDFLAFGPWRAADSELCFGIVLSVNSEKRQKNYQKNYCWIDYKAVTDEFNKIKSSPLLLPLREVFISSSISLVRKSNLEKLLLQWNQFLSNQSQLVHTKVN